MALDTETLTLLLDAVRRFVHERLIPAEDERRRQVPPDIVREMRELGLFGLSIAPEHGGLGLNMEEEVRVVFELGQTSPAFRSLAGTNIGIGSQAIVLAGTDEQRARYLPRLASGELIGSFALTEPDAGSDAMALRVSAERDGDHYVLNGTKRYITNAPIAGLFSVMARTAPERRAASISCFSVEAGTPGLSIGRPDKKMGQSGALTSDVVFDNCRVPASALLGGEEGNGFRTSMRVLDKGRLHISALCVGIADRLLRDAVKYAIDRKQFGQPIAEFQLIQAMIADSRRAVRGALHGAGRRACATAARTPPCRRPAASSMPPRWWAAWPTARCRSTAAPAICPSTRSSAFTATCACSASSRAPRRSSSW